VKPGSKNIYTTLIVTLLSLGILLIIFPGCEEDLPSEPDPDRGVALMNIAFLYRTQFELSKLNQIRISLLTSANTLSDFDLNSGDAESQLQSIYETTTDYLEYAGLMDETGKVLAAYPAKYDSLLTEMENNYIPWVKFAMDSLRPSIGEVEQNEAGMGNFDYIFPVIKDSSLKGMVWASVSFDTLTRRILVYTAPNSTEDILIFLLEEDGRIIYDHNENTFGVVYNDIAVFDSNNVALANKMLEAESGHSKYFASHSPGAEIDGEERLIGWTRIYLEQTYWIIAVTEPVLVE